MHSAQKSEAKYCSVVRLMNQVKKNSIVYIRLHLHSAILYHRIGLLGSRVLIFHNQKDLRVFFSIYRALALLPYLSTDLGFCGYMYGNQALTTLLKVIFGYLMDQDISVSQAVP